MNTNQVFLIAEAGVNHNGDLSTAKELIRVASDAGVDAVKFQTFSADRLVTSQAPRAGYQRSNTKSDGPQYDMLKKLQLKEKFHYVLMNECLKRNVLFLSTPFDEKSADFLDHLGVPFFKVGSGDVTNLPLLSHIASKRKPILLSTGMSHYHHIDHALAAIRRVDRDLRVVLMHCTSCYPTTDRDANLKCVVSLKERYGLAVGYSDHTLGWEASLSAVAMGARVIEKHFTLNTGAPGPDHRASLSAGELGEFVKRIKKIETLLGDGVKKPSRRELANRSVVWRSIVAKKNLRRGYRLKQSDLIMKRPGSGIPPGDLPKVLNRVLKQDVRKDSLLSWDVLR